MEPLTGPLVADDIAELRGLGAAVDHIGQTVEGHPLIGATIGDPDLPLVSIVAGAHPDEPAGPLAALALLRSWSTSPLATQVRLAVVPQLDIDGTVAQRAWLTPWDGAVDLTRFITHAIRRSPGEDREFAWPGAPWAGTVLPECQAAADFLDDQGPAIAHLSLHGMASAEGVWYLLDHLAMTDARLWQDLRAAAVTAGLDLHEFIRHGDKGFRRVGLGFCTTPSGIHMRRTFLAAGDRQTAAGFGYGSMDSARLRARRQHAPAPLCAVSEFPLLVLPPAVKAERGGSRHLFASLATATDPARACEELLDIPGVTAVPLLDQVAGMLRMTTAVIQAAGRRQACTLSTCR